MTQQRWHYGSRHAYAEKATIHSTSIDNAEGVRFVDLLSATICMSGKHMFEVRGSDEVITGRKRTSVEGLWTLYEEQAGQVVRMGETTCLLLDLSLIHI